MSMIQRALVTGAAGFIGSLLCGDLLKQGYQVVGVDCLRPYYPLEIKRASLRSLEEQPRFEFHELDLCADDLKPAVASADLVFHQAARPGVRSSWAEGFEGSLRDNVLATQRLLEAARDSSVQRIVYASSSSVYGRVATTQMREDGPVRPFSPYGVTKLSAEQLCTVYAENWGLPTVSLRYFTVYGPRQRPDMATHRLIQAALRGTEFPLYGSGEYVRDFTYVDDIVEANIAAATASLAPGTILNIAGGAIVSMNELIFAVEAETGKPIRIADEGTKAGDVARTEADLSRARALLSWRPTTSLQEGVARQVEWHRSNQDLLSSA